MPVCTSATIFLWNRKRRTPRTKTTKIATPIATPIAIFTVFDIPPELFFGADVVREGLEEEVGDVEDEGEEEFVGIEGMRMELAQDGGSYPAKQSQTGVCPVETHCPLPLQLSVQRAVAQSVPVQPLLQSQLKRTKS